jgi:hypothetical protein
MLAVVNPLAFDLWSVPHNLGLAFPPHSCASPFLCGLKEMSQTPTDPQARVATPERRELQRAITKARWADPITAAKWRAALADPASRARKSEAARARWADPAAREKMIAKMRATNADPVVRQKKASATKERWADSAMREKIIAAMRTTTKRRRNGDTADC